ncbi:MAG TPA: hypothetical protein VFN59_01465, partial [Acidimicrobiales bacterium]|nr:hypothetical protein [Acidimicrobiales bacterium]
MAAIFLGYSPEGKQIRKVVSARTRAEAAEKLRALQRQADDGLPPVDSRLTVGQLLERWHDDVLRHQVSWSAAKNYKSVADHHLVPVLGRKKVAALTTADVDRLLSQKMDSGLSVSTVRRIRSVLAQALDQGIRWGVVARNVATLSRPPKQARQEGRSLTPDQADALLQALKGHRNEALYTLMLTTGLRRGEAL